VKTGWIFNQQEGERSMSPVSKDQREGLPNIKAVILDYGQVLVRCPTVREFERMAGMFNVPFASFHKLWEGSRDIYDRGDVTAEEYWLQLAARTNSTLIPEQIETLRQVEIEIWCHTDPEMLDWLSRMHAAGIKTALLSNMPLDLMRYVLANFRWMEKFDFRTFSADVRLIKPDPAIFEHTLRGLGVAASEAVFVDDREPNIKAADALGIHGILFRSVAQLKDDLKAMGFPVLPVVAERARISDRASAASAPVERPGEEVKFQL
jgi:putative hydrolase of the HAD superfamily